MTVQDEKVYYHAMAPLRAKGQALVAAAASPTLETFDYLDGSAWLVYPNKPSKDVLLKYIFPKAYFDWCRVYVTAALALKPAPGAGSTPKAKILWAIDVLAHATFGYMALNTQGFGWYVPNMATDMGGNPYPPVTDTQLEDSKSSYMGRMIISGHLPWYYWGGSGWNTVTKAPSGKPFVRQPMPFAFLPFPSSIPIQHKYAGKIDLGQGSTVPWPNPQWAIFVKGVQPWYAGGYSLPSYKNKDAKILAAAAAANDPALMQGILQWRMWALNDFWWPQNWRLQKAEMTFDGGGRPPNTVLLTDYIDYVGRQTPIPEVLLNKKPIGEEEAPNFYVGFTQGVDFALQGFLNLPSYEVVLQKYTQRWVTTYTPPPVSTVTYDSTGMAVGGNAQPTSHTDFDQLEANQPKKILALYEDELKHPEKYMSKDAAKAEQWLQSKVNFPGRDQLIQQWTKFAAWFGLAVGVDKVAQENFVVGNPFIRTLGAVGYNTAAEGSSVNLMVRVVSAIMNIEALSGLDFGVYALPGAVSSTNQDCIALVNLAYSQGDPRDIAVLQPGDKQLLINACEAEFVTHSKPAGSSLQYLTTLLAQRHAEARRTSTRDLTGHPYRDNFVDGLLTWRGLKKTAALLKG